MPPGKPNFLELEEALPSPRGQEALSFGENLLEEAPPPREALAFSHNPLSMAFKRKWREQQKWRALNSARASPNLQGKFLIPQRPLMFLRRRGLFVINALTFGPFGIRIEEFLITSISRQFEALEVFHRKFCRSFVSNYERSLWGFCQRSAVFLPISRQADFPRQPFGNGCRRRRPPGLWPKAKFGARRWRP